MSGHEYTFVHTHKTPLLNLGYRVFMRRNSIYLAFVLTGAVVGERVLNYGMDKLWDSANKGKQFKDLLEEGKIGAGSAADE